VLKFDLMDSIKAS